MLVEGLHWHRKYGFTFIHVLYSSISILILKYNEICSCVVHVFIFCLSVPGSGANLPRLCDTWTSTRISKKHNYCVCFFCSVLLLFILFVLGFLFPDVLSFYLIHYGNVWRCFWLVTNFEIIFFSF